MTKFIKVTCAASGAEIILNAHWLAAAIRSEDGGCEISVKRALHLAGTDQFKFRILESFEEIQKLLLDEN